MTDAEIMKLIEGLYGPDDGGETLRAVVERLRSREALIPTAARERANRLIEERNAAIARADAAEAALRDAERRAGEAAERMRERIAQVFDQNDMHSTANEIRAIPVEGK